MNVVLTKYRNFYHVTGNENNKSVNMHFTTKKDALIFINSEHLKLTLFVTKKN